MSDSTINSTAADIGGSDLSNLYSVINRDSVYGLNLSVPEDAKAIIKPWDQREDTSQFIDSGVDDQVIIHIPFSQNVRIRSMILKIGRGESTPRRLRIYANHPTIVDFADAEETKPQLELSLLEGEVSATEYPLRVAAFASINTLSLFFVSSRLTSLRKYLIVRLESHAVGDEVSRVYYVGFKGDTTSPRKDGTQKLEIPAANAADASLVDRVSEKSGSQQTTAR
ncbi:hypothetical protein CCMSSC00406_0005608 [Pleurotus cornucopiae]|uniref:Uncharacterized protein n=1 Tax=Pleurotus cornucopiae TaxID=5321 RepID=A0ACB7IUN9_PLECO|nr:hypothetical protein CCMSSC00406_0005608 [Pleurotus cornucopiae]